MNAQNYFTEMIIKQKYVLTQVKYGLRGNYHMKNTSILVFLI